MPATYRLDAPARAIAMALGADGGDDPWAGGGIVPGGYAPVVIAAKGRRWIEPRQWGVPPPPRGDHVVTHVRNLDSPFWIGTLRHTEFRAIVPATSVQLRGGWYASPLLPIMGLAGIWRDSEVPSFAILTTQAEPGGPVLPVILPPEHYGSWLSAEWKHARGLVDGRAPGALRRLGEQSGI